MENMNLEQVIAIVLSKTMKQTNYKHSEEKVSELIKPMDVKKHHYENVRNKSVESIAIILEVLKSSNSTNPQYSILYHKVKQIRSIFDKYLREEENSSLSRVYFLENELRDIKNIYDKIYNEIQKKDECGAPVGQIRHNIITLTDVFE